jgi:hypothetical protein
VKGRCPRPLDDGDADGSFIKRDLRLPALVLFFNK